jgi:hypothetical protein
MSHLYHPIHGRVLPRNDSTSKLILGLFPANLIIVYNVGILKLEDKLKEKVSSTLNISGASLRQDQKQSEANAKKISLSGEKDVFAKYILDFRLSGLVEFLPRFYHLKNSNYVWLACELATN